MQFPMELPDMPGEGSFGFPIPLVGNVHVDDENAFVVWCTQNGVEAPNLLYPAFDEHGMRGILAKETIDRGSTLIRVPARICLTAAGAHADPVCGHVWSHPRLEPLLGSSVDMLIASYLAWLRTVAKHDTNLWPWIRIIPDVDCLSDWTGLELNELQDPELAHEANERALIMERNSLQLTSALSETFPDLFPSSLYTPTWWRWAAKQLNARAFGRRVPHVMLVPLADCFNHGPVSMKYDLTAPPGGEENVDFAHIDDNDIMKRIHRSDAVDGVSDMPPERASVPATFSIFLTKDTCFEQGAQVLISYGRRSNAFLAMEYGFVPNENDFDSLLVSPRPVVVPLRDSCSGSPGAAPTARYLFVPPECRALFAAVCTAGKPFTLCRTSWCAQSLASFRVCVADEEDLGNWRAGVSLVWTRPVSICNEVRALRSMVAYLRSCLSAFPTHIDTDTAILRDLKVDVGPRIRLAVIYRKGCKTLLLEHAHAAEAIADMLEVSKQDNRKTKVTEVAVGEPVSTTPHAFSKLARSYGRTGTLTDQQFRMLCGTA